MDTTLKEDVVLKTAVVFTKITEVKEIKTGEAAVTSIIRHKFSSMILRVTLTITNVSS